MSKAKKIFSDCDFGKRIFDRIYARNDALRFADQYKKAVVEAKARPPGKYSVLRRQKSDSEYETDESYDEDFRR